MRVFFGVLLSVVGLIGCKEKSSKSIRKDTIITAKTVELVVVPTLNLEEANRLAELPLHCAVVEYPNKLGSASDLESPKTLHPAFYGCFDWHSAVHGHWSMVFLLKEFPKIDVATKLEAILKKHITKENIEIEVAYFASEFNKSWERTYGWAWLLKLAGELHTWDNPLARELEDNLKPLTLLIVEKYKTFIPKLQYPIRVGEHPNTAFGLSFAYDYAAAVKDVEFIKIITQSAKNFYQKDKECPISWEPGGFDFLSPCLEEAAIMKRVLTKEDFLVWINNFLPELKDKKYSLDVGIVSDRSDGKMVHLDGVNFSRAWSLNKIAEGLPEYAHLRNIANKHINYSLPGIVGDSYEGGHWLGSFAIYALDSSR